MKNDSDIYSRIICIGNHKVLSFNLELIWTSEFFKNLKLHKPVRRVRLHFNTVRVYAVITTDPVIFGSLIRFKQVSIWNIVVLNCERKICNATRKKIAAWTQLRKSLHTSQLAHQAGAYLGFSSMKRLRVFLLPPGWDNSPSQGYPSIKFTSTHLYTWVELERGTIRVKCLYQEHNTMSPAKARSPTPRSSVERTNHKATALTKKAKLISCLNGIRFDISTWL